ncbi:MAG: T9SS type A sorting domain-containing protein [Ignavibacteria bacterium]
MKTKLFLTIYFITCSFLLSQNINVFGTGYGYYPSLATNDINSKFKNDINGNSYIVSLGRDSRFYATKITDNKIYAPFPVGKIPSSSISVWDFDIDINGVFHIAGFTGESPYLSLFYINSSNGIPVIVSTVPADSAFQTYIRVLRTTDNQLIVNYVYRQGQSLKWTQLVNPTSSNLNKFENNIDLSPYNTSPYVLERLDYSANKNLFFYVLYAYDPIPFDSILVTYKTLKVSNNGVLVYLSGQTFVLSPFGNPYHLLLPLANNNDQYINWIIAECNYSNFLNKGPIYIRDFYIDNSNNFYFINQWNNNLYYYVYTAQNLPINSPGSSPYRQILITSQNLTYRTDSIIQTYPFPVSLGVSNLNKAFILFSNIITPVKMVRNIGATLLRIENNSINQEYIITIGNQEVAADEYQFWLYRNNKTFLSKFSQYDSIDVNHGRFYFFPIKYDNGELLSNYKESEILKFEFPQINPSNTPYKFKFDENGLSYILSMTIDTIKYIAGREKFGRLYLTKETSPGVWIQQIISNDTLSYSNQANSKNDIDIDKNGVVHCVYSFNRKLFYTNNSTGQFQTPIVVDSATYDYYFFVNVRAYSTDTVYILAKTGYGLYRLYFGNYNNNFNKSNITFSSTWPPVLAVDNNNNAFVFNPERFSSSGIYDYYYYKFHYNNFIFRRKFLSFPAQVPSRLYIDAAYDKNRIVHLIAGDNVNPKIYYANSTNDFSNPVEYDLNTISNIFNFRTTYPYIGTIKLYPSSNENKIYFTMVLGSENSIAYPASFGWLPYTMTNVENPEGIIVDNFRLYQNYPNPFNPSTKFKFSLPEKANVKIEIYDILGQKIYEFPERIFEPGTYEEEWNGIDNQNSKVSSGIYFLKLNAKSGHNKVFTDIKKMVLMK